MSPEIVKSMARAFFADAWATAMEEAGRSRELSGNDILDIMPQKIPMEAYDAALDLINAIEAANNELPFKEWVVHVRELPRSWDNPDLDNDEVFGHYLVMQSLGHGVGLNDALKQKIKVPYSDNILVEIEDDEE